MLDCLALGVMAMETSMKTVSLEEKESTRKKAAIIQSAILRQLAATKQSIAADRIGVNESTISRQKEDLERFCLLLAAIGLDVSPTDAVVVERTEIAALEGLAFKYLKARVEGRRGE